MNKVQISAVQLFVLMVLSQLGSAVVIGIGMDAKQDAWLAILVAMLAGLLLFQVYSYLHHTFPDIPLTKYPEAILGKFLGKIISLLYIIYFFYIGARVLRDFGELVIATLLHDTPLIAILILMAAVVFYSCLKELETLARTAEILFPYMMIWGGLFILFIFIGQLPEAKNLQPVLENGWKSVFQAAFPTVLTFPFGETIIFLLIMYHVRNKMKATVVGSLSIVVSGVILMLTTAMNIAVLGPTIAAMEQVPLLATISKVNVADVFQRLDPLVISILVVGGFFKISIFFCFSMRGLNDIFQFKHRNRVYFVFIILLVITSVFIAESYTEHIKIGLELVPKYLHVPFQIIFPFIMALIVFIKRKFSKSKKE